MFGDMLFDNTHSVEQLVDIKKKKKVDKVLLKVVKTVRQRGSVSAWIKPESDLRKDLNISNKALTNICDVLGEYYQLPIDASMMNSIQDIVCYIKGHQATAADNIFLINTADLETDENNDTAEPTENLEVDPEIISKSEASNPDEEDVPDGTEASTEGAITNGIIAGIIVCATRVFFQEWKKEKRAQNRAELEKDKQYFLNNYGKVITHINQLYGNSEKSPDKSKTKALLDKEQKLWSMSTIYSLYEKSRIQFNRISGIPYPKDGESDSSYCSRLKEYFSGRLTPLKSPEKDMITYADAGYLDTKDVRRNWYFFSHRFNFYKDQAIKFLKLYEERTQGKYKSYLTKLGVYDIVNPSKSDHKARYAWAVGWVSDLLNLFKVFKDDIKTVEQAQLKKSEESISLSQEGIPDIVFVGAAVVGLASGIYFAVKLYQDRKMKELCTWTEDHYSDICKFIKEKMKDDAAFFEKRDTLWHIDDLLEICDSRIDQLKKLNKFPDPYSGEPADLYKERLEKYFENGRMEDRIYPAHPAYLCIDEAGYLEASKVKSYIKKLSEMFDLQDDLDTKINNIRKTSGPTGIQYLTKLTELNIMSHQRGLYKEQWPDNFNDHVLKVIASKVKNYKEEIDPPKEEDSSEEKLVNQESRKLTVIVPSMEHMVNVDVAVSEQQESTEWGSMLNSL